MGSNEQFPPPPPPGQPPQQPGFPTQQVPTTQAYPQQGYAPAAAAPKKGNGLLIGGGLVVAAALIGGVVLLMGGDDDKKTSGITLAPVTTLATATTAPVITLAPTVAPTDPVVPTTVDDSGIITVTDDTGMFSMLLPDYFEADTSTTTSTDGFTIPSISASETLSSYVVDDVTFGLTAIAVGPEIGSDAAQVMEFLEPEDGTCTGRVADTAETFYGTATRVSLTGCNGTAGNKVLMVVALADRPVVIGIYVQALAAVADIQGFAQSELESMVAL